MCTKKQGSFEDLAVIGVDIGKDVFHLVGFDRPIWSDRIRMYSAEQSG